MVSVKGSSRDEPPTVPVLVAPKEWQIRTTRRCHPVRRVRSSMRGAAMVTTLAATTMILALATAGLLLARSDLILFQNQRDGMVTSFRAHGAAVQVADGLAAGYGFDTFLVGPDGLPETGDDGTFSIPLLMPGCTVTIEDDRADPTADPFSDGNSRIHVVARCSGPRGARRHVEAIIGREGKPFVPAALYLERPDMEAAARVTVDGADHRYHDPPGAASGSAGPVPAAASPALDEPWLLPSGVVDGRENQVSAVPAQEIDVQAFADRTLALGPPLSSSLPQGAVMAQFAHARGDIRVASADAGSGLLLVDGQLEIEAPFEFAGVLIVGGTLRIADSGSLTVRGWLWVQGNGPGLLISAAGPLTVLYSQDAVATADGIFSLPRRARLLTEREVS